MSTITDYTLPQAIERMSLELEVAKVQQYAITNFPDLTKIQRELLSHIQSAKHDRNYSQLAVNLSAFEQARGRPADNSCKVLDSGFEIIIGSDLRDYAFAFANTSESHILDTDVAWIHYEWRYTPGGMNWDMSEGLHVLVKISGWHEDQTTYKLFWDQKSKTMNWFSSDGRPYQNHVHEGLCTKSELKHQVKRFAVWLNTPQKTAMYK